MKFSDYIRVAFKNLIRQKARTILTIIAIVIGSLSVVLMLSLVIGARSALFSSMEEMGALSLITVTGDPNSAGGEGMFGGGGGDTGEGEKLDGETVNKFKSLANVFDATPLASNIWVKGMRLEGQDKKSWGNLTGYDPGTQVFKITISAGRTLNKNDLDKMVISSDYLRELDYAGKADEIIGKKMILIFEGGNYPDFGADPPKPPMGDNKDWWEEQKNNKIEIPVEIVGVAESGPGGGGQNFITLAFAEKLMTQKNWQWSDGGDKSKSEGSNYQPTLTLEKTNNLEKDGYSSIMIKADDTEFVEGIAEEIKKEGYGVSTAKEMIAEMTRAFTGIGIVLGAIGGVALFVAAIGIINTMVMATYERTKEIGVLRACGATRAAIRKLFILEAGMIGFWGGVFGLGFSYGIAQVGNLISNRYFSQYSIPIQNIASFPLWLIIGVLIFTTLLGILAGLYPAIKASHLDPVEALRYE